MQRYDVINSLIERYGYKKYLEIGTQSDACLRNVKCEFKVGIDPDPFAHDVKWSSEFYKMTSDEFFFQNYDIFDIIFVDGLHEEKQVIKDISNALRCVTQNGAIIIHDCNPQEEINQKFPMPHVGDWNGTVWKAWLRYRMIKNLKMFVVDCDQGCGVIMEGTQNVILDASIPFDVFKDNREKYLNLISTDGFNESLSV